MAGLSRRFQDNNKLCCLRAAWLCSIVLMMKRLIHNLLLVIGSIVYISSGLMGIFAGMGVCAAGWGEGILSTALGRPPDYSHPAFWLFVLIAFPGMVIGFVGGAFVLGLLRALAKWQIGEGEKPDLRLWLKKLLF